MNELELIKHPTVVSCVQRHRQNLLAKEQFKYNLFSLSSYNTYLENFHSDVIHSLLDINGLHNEGDRFLNLFIHYLNEQYQFQINSADFQSARVEREVGDAESHIDIVIWGIE